jgi:hypothetical protein
MFGIGLIPYCGGDGAGYLMSYNKDDGHTLYVTTRVVILGIWRPFGGRTGRAGGWPCPLRLI